MFDTCLPHPETLSKWYKAIDGKPGLTEVSFTALKARADAEKLAGKEVVCALMFDEIALRQQVEFSGKDYCGYIDMGTQLDDDSLPLAKEALVFMVSS
ncbi:hypothetical protein HOLleu_03139 [Holothuria leucospilota]|uniref:Transposable element P transposase-like RNase H domain-containing protein n=1 Tax=Holothuria leucospilota TaxID=206669 RepID=A0A9Q1CS72_HOLLE|nr:hypothetical protein HOLleu_03139 [Holothuria leucospilota]